MKIEFVGSNSIKLLRLELSFVKDIALRVSASAE